MTEQYEYVEYIEETNTEENTVTEETKTITLTPALEAYINQQVDYLAQSAWNNLVYIAATAVCDFGVEPTFDDCKYNALAIAMSPERAKRKGKQWDVLARISIKYYYS